MAARLQALHLLHITPLYHVENSRWASRPAFDRPKIVSLRWICRARAFLCLHRRRGSDTRAAAGFWCETSRETCDRICRFKRQNLSLCETGISSAGEGFKHVLQSRPSMISTGGVGGESPWPGVGGAHNLECPAYPARCRVIASRSRFSSSSSSSCLPSCFPILCASGSDGSRCRRPRPCVLVRSLLPARGGGWELASRLRAYLLPCSLPHVLLAAGPLLLDGGLCPWVRVVRDRSAGRSGRGPALVATAVPRVPGGCRQPRQGGPSPRACGRSGVLRQLFRAAALATCCRWAGASAWSYLRPR